MKLKNTGAESSVGGGHGAAHTCCFTPTALADLRKRKKRGCMHPTEDDGITCVCVWGGAGGLRIWSASVHGGSLRGLSVPVTPPG